MVTVAGPNQRSPRSDQRRFLRIVESSPSPRDRAMATVFFYGGLRLSELAALDVAHVEVSARRGRLKVRSGKGDAYREVPLNSATRKALDEWLEDAIDAEQADGHEVSDEAKAHLSFSHFEAINPYGTMIFDIATVLERSRRPLRRP